MNLLLQQTVHDVVFMMAIIMTVQMVTALFDFIGKMVVGSFPFFTLPILEVDVD